MEPVGLAVGIAGLGGLFTTCLDAVQRIDAYKDFGRDSRSLAARFEADRLRLSRWGDVTGVRTATSDDQNHPALNDPAIRAQVSNIFSIIRDFYNHGDEDGIVSFRGDSSTVGDSEEGLRQNKESRRQKLSWALRGKSKQVAQVEQFENLVQKLYELVPIASPLETKSRNDSDKPETLITEVRGTFEKEIAAKTRRDLHSWLGCVVQEPAYSNAIKKRVSGTCDWILSHPAFVHWMQSSPGGSSRILWVNGAAGFGKTVLCARIVEYLFSTLKTPIAHFFLSGNSESRDDPYLALRSWISQIITSNATAYELVRQIWLEQSIQVAPRAIILNVFARVVEAIPDCTLVLDGLDECTWLGREYPSDDNISVFLRSILSAVENTATKILVVSRDELEIRQGFDDAHSLVELKISPVHVQNDTLLYSRSIVEAKLKKKDSVTKAEISTKLATRCQGQFLWLKLQENSLRSWKNKKQLGEAIEKTPSGLERLYERDWVRMARLPDEEQRRAYSLLRWAVFALRPLTIAEVVEALLIDPERGNLAIEEMPDSIDEEYIDSEIIGLCGSLLEVRDNYMTGSAVGAQTIHLAHFSVKEYFLGHSYVQGMFSQTNDRLQRSNSAFEIGHLAKLCLLYLCFPQSWADCDEARNKFTEAHEINIVRGSFKRYAALRWFQHASAGLVDDKQLLVLVKRLFDQNNHIWHAWRKLWFDATYSFSSENDPYSSFTPLHFGSPFGQNNNHIWHAWRELLFDATYSFSSENDQDSSFTPLHFASLFGLKEVVRHYLEHAEYSLDEMCFPGTLL